MTTTLIYGPQTPRIEELLAAVRSMTLEQASRAAAVAWDSAWVGPWCVAMSAARADCWAAARAAARAATARGAATRDCVLAASDALVVLDLVGRYGLTREHVDVLSAPMLKIMPELAPLFEPIVTTAETELQP